MNNRDYESLDFNDVSIVNEMLLNNISIDNILYGTYEGYIKGNMFRNLYNQYKNYIPTKLTPVSEQDELLLNLNQLSFALHDIRLYLDINPNNKEMREIFNNYKKMFEDVIKIYEEKYGSNTNNYSWEKGDK